MGNRDKAAVLPHPGSKVGLPYEDGRIANFTVTYVNVGKMRVTLQFTGMSEMPKKQELSSIINPNSEEGQLILRTNDYI